LSKIYNDLRSAEESRILPAASPDPSGFGSDKQVVSPKLTDLTLETQLESSLASAPGVGPRLRIKGQVSGNEDLQVDGFVEGPVHLREGRLTVGVSGKIAGDVVAHEVVVYGCIQGNVQAERFEIKPKGSVVGEVLTGRAVIDEGAYFKGTIEIVNRAINLVAAVQKMSQMLVGKTQVRRAG